MADGQLDEQDFPPRLRHVAQDDVSLDCWNTYHLIGDLLRPPANPCASLVVGGEPGLPAGSPHELRRRLLPCESICRLLAAPAFFITVAGSTTVLC
jgi:hypothetical protein